VRRPPDSVAINPLPVDAACDVMPALLVASLEVVAPFTTSATPAFASRSRSARPSTTLPSPPLNVIYS
jgi:hypothetical protein